jgi:hypothetical protein
LCVVGFVGDLLPEDIVFTDCLKRFIGETAVAWKKSKRIRQSNQGGFRPMKRHASAYLGTRCPAVEALETRRMLANDLSALVTSLDSQLVAAESSLVGVLNASKAVLPVLNRPLSGIPEIRPVADDPKTPLDESRPGIIDNIRAKLVQGLNALTDGEMTQLQIRNQLFNTLRTAGILGTIDGSLRPTTINDVDVSPAGYDANGKLNNISIRVRLAGKINVANENFKLGLGLSAVPLRIDSNGGLAVFAEFEYKELKFGLENGLAFFDTSSADEFSLKIDARLTPNSQLTGVVGFMRLTASPGPEGATGLSAQVIFDVTSNNKFATNVKLSSPRLNGQADINLTLVASMSKFAGGLDGSPNDKVRFLLPTIETEFQLHWPFNGSDPRNGTDQLGAVPSVAFKDVRVALNELVSNTLGPMLRDIQTQLAPLDTAFNLFNFRIPGLSELSEEADLGPITPLVLARAADGNVPLPPDIKAIIRLIDTANNINSIINKIKVSDNNLKIHFGDFSLTESNGDLRSRTLNQLPEDLATYLDKLGDRDQLTQLASKLGGEAQKLLDRLKADPRIPEFAKDGIKELERYLATLNNKVQFEFPFLDDPGGGVFRLFLGQDADLVKFTVEYHSPPFNAFEESYPLFKLGPVDVNAVARGELDFDFKYVAGYDTYGLRQSFKTVNGIPKDSAGFAAGFYIGTQEPIIKATGSVGMGPEASLPFFQFVHPLGFLLTPVKLSAEIIGGVSIKDFFIQFTDYDGDNKFRIFSEIFLPAAQGKPFINTGGTLDVNLKFNVVARTPIPLLDDVVLYSKQLAATRLLDLSLPQYQVNPFLPPPGQPPGKIPFALDLNSLPTANDGQDDKWIVRVNQADILEVVQVTVLKFGEETFEIETVLPISPPASQVSELLLWGSSDADAFIIDGSVKVPVKLDGRNGKNSLKFLESAVSSQPTYTLYETRTGAYPQRLERLYDNELNVNIFHAGMQSVVVTAKREIGGNFLVRGVPLGTNVTLVGGQQNFWGVGSALLHMNEMLGKLEILGGSGGQDFVTMSDLRNSDRFSTTSFLVTENRVQRIRTRRFDNGLDVSQNVDILDVSLQGINRLDISGSSSQPTTFSVAGNMLNQVFIVGGSQNDTFVVGSSAHGMDTFFEKSAVDRFGQVIPQQLSFHGAGGNDLLVFQDLNARTSPATVEMSYTFAAVPALPRINELTTKFSRRVIERGLNQDDNVVEFQDSDAFFFSNFEDVQVYGKAFNGALYAIESFGGKRTTNQLTVYTNRSDDVVHVGAFPNGLDAIGATLVLHDLGGNDQLSIFGTRIDVGGDPLNNAPLVQAGRLTNFPLTFSGVENLRLKGLGSNSQAQLFATPIGTATIVDSVRNVNVGGGKLANIRGNLEIITFAFSDFFIPTDLIIDDSAASISSRLELGLHEVRSPSENPIVFESALLTALTLRGGAAGNEVILVDSRSSIPYILNTGLGDDTVYVYRSNSSITINGQRGADVVKVGLLGNMQEIRGALSVTNIGNWSRLELDNRHGQNARAVTINSTNTLGTVSGLSPGIITFNRKDIRSLTVHGGVGSNVYDVVNTHLSTHPAGTLTTIYAGGGNDILNIHGTTGALAIDGGDGWNQITVGGPRGRLGTLNRLAGKITLYGHVQATNDVVITDSASSGALGYDYTLTANQFTRRDRSTGIAQGTVEFGELQGFYNFEIYGGSQGNHFHVNGTPPVLGPTGAGIAIVTGNGDDTMVVRGTASPLYVNLGSGLIQSISIGDQFSSLDAVGGPIVVTGLGLIGAYIDDSASPITTRIKVDYDTVQGSLFSRYDALVVNGVNRLVNSFQFRFIEFGRIHYQAGRVFETGYYNQVDIDAVPANTEVEVHGGPDYDVFTVGFAADVRRILGPVTIHSLQADLDFAYFYDYLNPMANSTTLITNPTDDTGVVLERVGMPKITYNGLTQLIFFAPLLGGNSINVRSLPASLFLNMAVSDDDSIMMGSAAPALGGSMDSIMGSMALSSYRVDDHVRVTYDDSGNSLHPRNVTISPSESSGPWGTITGLGMSSLLFRDYETWDVRLLGGQLNDIYVIGGNTFNADITIDGGSGNNLLQGANLANHWEITSNNAGVLQGSVSFSSMQNFYGSVDFDDRFVFSDGAAIAGTIDGFGGVNTLDYSDYSTSVIVYLPLQVATGAALVANIQHVTGGSGDDILWGAGNNLLQGGAGRDLLIAGALASILDGGEGEDLLIGGNVIDSTPQNLMAIKQQWTAVGPGADYAARVAGLRATLLADDKLIGNGGNNQMTGGAVAQDLFFGSLATDLDVQEWLFGI